MRIKTSTEKRFILILDFIKLRYNIIYFSIFILYSLSQIKCFLKFETKLILIENLKKPSIQNQIIVAMKSYKLYASCLSLYYMILNY